MCPFVALLYEMETGKVYVAGGVEATILGPMTCRAPPLYVDSQFAIRQTEQACVL